MLKIFRVSDYGSNVIGYPFLLWKRNASITVPGWLPAGNTLEPPVQATIGNHGRY